VTPGRTRLLALAVALSPARAQALLARLGGGEAEPLLERAAALAGAPRRERLLALAAALGEDAASSTPSPDRHPLLARLLAERSWSAPRTTGSAADLGSAAKRSGGPDRAGTARGRTRGMTLPFDLPACSRGFAALDAGARTAGREAAAAAALAVGEVLGVGVSLEGRPRPVAPSAGAEVARLHLELAALPGSAILEVEPTLVARVVEAMAGGHPTTPAAASLSAVEEAALELLVLAALDGASSVAGIGERLAPRLVRAAAPPPSPLAIDLEITAGEVRGRARLLLPPAAVAALAAPPALEEPLLGFPLFASLRGGSAPLLPEELAALAPGDVVVVDPPPRGRHRLLFPGGFTAVGPVADGVFQVEETGMDERLAEVPVMLEVELARVPLTLADLARLAPGATLPLHLDQRGLVTLRLGERALARGELVELDGAVGVRIISLEASP